VQNPLTRTSERPAGTSEWPAGTRQRLGFVSCGEEEEEEKSCERGELETLNWKSRAFCLNSILLSLFFLVNVEPQGINFIPPKNEWNQAP